MLPLFLQQFLLFACMPLLFLFMLFLLKCFLLLLLGVPLLFLGLFLFLGLLLSLGVLLLRRLPRPALLNQNDERIFGARGVEEPKRQADRSCGDQRLIRETHFY